MKNILVCDLMTRNPLTVGPETNLLDCAKKMLKNKVGALLIVNKNKKLLGYIAQKEILWTIVKKSKNLSGIKAIDISARKLTTIPPKLTIKEAMKRMKKYKRLPVVQKGELVGLLSAKDILNFNPDFYPEFEEMSEIRDERFSSGFLESSLNSWIKSESSNFIVFCANKFSTLGSKSLNLFKTSSSSPRDFNISFICLLE